MKADIKEELSIPENVTVTIGGAITVKGTKGEVSRVLKHPRVTLKQEGNVVVLQSSKATKREKKTMYTFAAHLRNMFRGVTEGHFYELKVCAAHFPMNVSVSGNVFIIKNFLGENSPRTLEINEAVTVKVNGDIVRVESTDKEKAGRTASQIELLTRVRNRDRRIFQDGIFLINKDGRVLQ
jgi:large subunit ribosomal protein L6